MITWTLFYYLRSRIYEFPFQIPKEFFAGLVIYTAGWIGLNHLAGFYHSVYQKSRIGDLFKTLLVCLIGAVVLLFFYILKSPRPDTMKYYLEFFSLFLPIFLLTAVTRLTIINQARQQIKDGVVYFNTLLIGAGQMLRELAKRVSENSDNGFKLAAIMNMDASEANHLPKNISLLTPAYGLEKAIQQFGINEVLIAVDKKDSEVIVSLLQRLSTQDVNIKISPDNLDLLSGNVNPYSDLGIPLIDVHYGQLPLWQQNVKRLFDVVASFICLIVFSPLITVAMFRVMVSSRGPAIYTQQRIGFKGRPFIMYKIRSMIHHAEKHGPQLSSENDPRITNWGRFMRKWRIDELPQLWNILKGDMSFVGPRPERRFFIDQLVKLHPEYNYLFKVKPGLSSWGMVKYGYASNLDEMVLRMRYDLMYVEDASLALDIRIMWHTLSIIFQGKGK